MGSQKQDSHKEQKNCYIMLNIFFDRRKENNTIYVVIVINLGGSSHLPSTLLALDANNDGRVNKKTRKKYAIISSSPQLMNQLKQQTFYATIA
jgi:hypothetical protein